MLTVVNRSFLLFIRDPQKVDSGGFGKLQVQNSRFQEVAKRLPEQSKFRNWLSGKIKYGMSVFEKFKKSWPTKMKFQKQLVDQSEVAQQVA